MRCLEQFKLWNKQMKEQDLSIVIFYQKKDRAKQLEKVIASTFKNYCSVNIEHIETTPQLPHPANKVLFVYAIEDIDLSKEVCQRVEESEAYSDLILLPHSHFLFCLVSDIKKAFEACIEGPFTDYSTINPIYDSWNLVLRFIRIMQFLELKENHENHLTMVEQGIQELTNNLENLPDKFKSLGKSQSDRIDQILAYLDEIKLDNDEVSKVNVIKRKNDELIDQVTVDLKRESERSAQIRSQIQSRSVAAKTILLAEDQFIMAEIVRTILEPKGYKVIQAKDGLEAFRKVSLLMPDLVLMDINMPKMDGLNTLKKLKSIDKTAHIPIIMLTGHTDKEHINKAIKFGSDDYIVKPVTADILLNKMSAVLKKKQI